MVSSAGSTRWPNAKACERRSASGRPLRARNTRSVTARASGPATRTTPRAPPGAVATAQMVEVCMKLTTINMRGNTSSTLRIEQLTCRRNVAGKSERVEQEIAIITSLQTGSDERKRLQTVAVEAELSEQSTPLPAAQTPVGQSMAEHVETIDVGCRSTNRQK